MCGIFGLVSPAGRASSLTDEQAISLRDRMVHRGQDDAGFFRRDSVLFAHRRLAVLDPSMAGRQPFVDAQHALVYNGELYNDALVRKELSPLTFRTCCDTETLFEGLKSQGADLLPRLRGMYAFAFADFQSRRVLLARDPLGIKPLYYTVTTRGELLFASEASPIIAHPDVVARPDWATVAAYLCTIRTTLGGQSMYEHVRILQPGEWIEFDLDEVRPVRRGMTLLPPHHPTESDAVAESVRVHLRSDVPMCSLLSGGLDSTIVVAEATRHVAGLHTYCAGAEGHTGGDQQMAEAAARWFGTSHTFVPITRATFLERWLEMTERNALPMSTPNEVAIHEVARALRREGKIVALSGEGADELLGGYDLALGAAAEAHAARRLTLAEAARVELETSSWLPVDALPGVLRQGSPVTAGPLIETYEEAMRGAGYLEREEPLQAHLQCQRRINLAGLLLRIDQSTMLAGVEARTPFADVEVAAWAESLPMADKFDATCSRTTGAERAAATKRILRRGYAGRVPKEILERPKTSFPLPFEEWLADAGWLKSTLNNGFVREVFSEAVVPALLANPGRLWRVLWPVLNAARWGARFS